MFSGIFVDGVQQKNVRSDVYKIYYIIEIREMVFPRGKDVRDGFFVHPPTEDQDMSL